MTFATHSPNMPQGGFAQGGLAQAMSQMPQGANLFQYAMQQQQRPQAPQPSGGVYDPAMMQMLRSGDGMGFLRASAPQPQPAQPPAAMNRIGDFKASLAGMMR